MAELVGFAAGILTLAEVGAKVAFTLGKLGVQLKHAGKEAKETSTKIKLVSKALKQVEAKLRDGQTSIDFSLVEDLFFVCKERMEEASHLVEVLEREMSSVKTWDRAKFRLRFLLEKSTFTTLEQDMNSLHLTLALYLITLTYQEANKHGKLLDETKEQLQELKQEVEDDLQIRSAGAAVQAALLTVQYGSFLSTGGSATQRPVSPVWTAKDSTERADDHNRQLADQSSAHALSLLMSHNGVRQSEGHQGISFDMLNDDTVSKTLVAFAQIQMVQKKTLHRLQLNVDLDEQSTELPQAMPVNSVTETVETRQEPETHVQTQNSGHDTGTEISERAQSADQDSQATSPRASQVGSSDGRQTPQTVHQVGPSSGQSTKDLAARSHAERIEREQVAYTHQNNTFFICNTKTGKDSQIDFSSLKRLTLPDIILDMHMASLSYDPPHPGLRLPGKDATDYQPPPRPVSSTHDAKTAPLDSNNNSRLKTLFSRSPEKRTLARDKLRLIHQQSVLSFGTYVLAYAQWYTDSCRLTALKNLEYRIEVYGDDSLVVGADMNDFPLEGLYSRLDPYASVYITFTNRRLVEANMFELVNPIDGEDLKLVDEAPHGADLRFLAGLVQD